MGSIPDFNEAELWAVRTALAERYGEEREFELAETELRLDKHSTRLVPCPTVYWRDGACHFVVCKTGPERYRCNFFYRVHQVFGTGIEEFDNLTECVVTLLQVQADHQREQEMSD